MTLLADIFIHVLSTNLRWPRELNALQLQKTHANKKKHQQIKKTSSHADSTHAANPHNTCKLRNATHAS